MTDSLTVFGTDYTGVTGIKAHKTSDSSLLAYIRPEGTKSISANGTGIDVAQYASVDVAVPSSAPTLQSKTKSYTPTETAQSETVTADMGYDGLSSVAVSVGAISSTYVGSGITRRDSTDLTASGATVSVPSGYYASNASKSVSSGTEGTPTATKGTVSNHAITVTPSVTNSAGYISGGTHSGTAVSVSASELVSGTYTVDSSGTKDVTNYASASVPALTLPSAPISSSTGTQKATIGRSTSTRYLNIPTGYNDTAQYYMISATSNMTLPSSVSTTSSGTKKASAIQSTSQVRYINIPTGYNDTAQYYELPALSLETLNATQNGTYYPEDTGFSQVVVNVSGGGGSSVQVATKTVTLSSAAQSISFSSLLGMPTSFFMLYEGTLAVDSTEKVSDVVMDGHLTHGSYITNTSGSQVSYSNTDVYYNVYSSDTLTISSSQRGFVAGDWTLIYTYGGTVACIDTKDVQVGSGATSITFTGLEDEPICWSCIFKSSFSTSSGYQRVICVANDGTDTFGMEMDSSAHYSDAHWTASYSNGSLTITSNSTNQGGYFHQPGYYQLTYAYDATGNYQSKTVTPTTSQQVVQADSGYDALKKVTVNAIPNTYVQPTSTVGSTTYRASTSSQTIQAGTYHSAAATIAAVTATNLEAGNIKNGTTITISNGQSNLWSVTGTYSGGGGGSASTDTKTVTASNRPSSLSFTSMKGEPIMWALRATFTMTSSSSTYYYVDSMRGIGTSNVQGRLFRMGSTRETQAVTTGYSASYSNGTFTVTSSGTRTASPGCFYNGTYELVYVY